MPNVNDIAAVAEALEKSPIFIDGDRCVCVRNRNASCRLCKSTCPFDAITIEGNEISLAASLCVGCGVCIASCPTEAIASTVVADATIVDNAAKSALENDGRAVVACSRIASKKAAHPDRFAEVPCIARIDQSLLLAILASGCESVHVVDGDCATCKYGACVQSLDSTIEDACNLVKARGVSANIQRVSEFPEFAVEESAAELYGSTRRGFFSEMATAAKDTALIAAQTTIEQELGINRDKPAIGERLRVGATGSLPVIATPRHDLLLNSFDAIGEPVAERIGTSRFATVSIDAQRCNACGMCAVFCPTNALKRDDAEKASSPLKYLEFSASMCVNCGMCKDVCWKGALEIEEGVTMEQLYDFEPVVFEMKSATKPPLFGTGY